MMIDIDNMLASYKPKSTKELAEWILIATKNLKDKEGKPIYFKLELDLALQMARMMQDAKLEVPTAADEIERLREALYECARNLEEQVSASYWHIEQPFDANIQRRYDRDMARAHKAFAALGEKE